MLSVESLHVDDRVAPLDVGARPTFSWALSSSVRGDAQTSHRVRIFGAPGSTLLWDSGAVSSSAQSVRVPADAPALPTRTPLSAQVDVTDAAHGVGRGARSTFALAPQNWTAEWFIHPADKTRRPPDNAGTQARTEFVVGSGPVASALLSVSGLGHAEVWINGQRVGASVLDPGWTNYNKTCLFVTHDVARLLRPGTDNAIGVYLGNGYVSVGARAAPRVGYTKWHGAFGPRTLRLQLDITHTDGSRQRVATGAGGAWRVAEGGPLHFSHAYSGEDFDARREESGWTLPGFRYSASAQEWARAVAWAGPGCALRAQTTPPLQTTTVRAVASWRFEHGRPGAAGVPSRVFDLGHNMGGWPAIRVLGARGTIVRLRCGELLSNASSASRGWPASSFGWPGDGQYNYEYTLAGGNGTETWEPRFSLFGFRWVEAIVLRQAPSGLLEAAELDELDVTGRSVSSSASAVGHFSSSSPLFNRIHSIVATSMRSNHLSSWVDCPHRERLGWLEVAHLMAPSISYNWDVRLLLRKILDDAVEAQLPSGLVPNSVPEYHVGPGAFRDSPEWGLALVFLPHHLLTRYGDTRTLEKVYAPAARYVEYLHGKSEQGVLRYGLGDWCDANATEGHAADCGPSGQLTALGITATTLYYAALRHLSDFARRLGKADEARKWASRAADAAEAFVGTYWVNGSFGVASQTANAMPIALGLLDPPPQSRGTGRRLRSQALGDVPPPSRAAALAALLADIRKRGYHQSAGEIGHRFILTALSESGHDETVDRITKQTSAPSYGAMLAAGATSLPETWSGGGSQLHSMLGHVDEWFFSALAGLRSIDFSPALPAASADGADGADGGGSAGADTWLGAAQGSSPPELRIEPAVLSGVSAASADYATPRGRARVSWHLADQLQQSTAGSAGRPFQLNVSTPPGTRAWIRVIARAGTLREAGVNERELPGAAGDGARTTTSAALRVLRRQRDSATVEARGGGSYYFSSLV